MQLNCDLIATYLIYDFSVYHKIYCLTVLYIVNKMIIVPYFVFEFKQN